MANEKSCPVEIKTFYRDDKTSWACSPAIVKTILYFTQNLLFYIIVYSLIKIFKYPHYKLLQSRRLAISFSHAMQPGLVRHWQRSREQHTTTSEGVQ
jgi:hypothetical protein